VQVYSEWVLKGTEVGAARIRIVYLSSYYCQSLQVNEYYFNASVQLPQILLTILLLVPTALLDGLDPAGLPMNMLRSLWDGMQCQVRGR
jgi:hypothetical protein